MFKVFKVLFLFFCFFFNLDLPMLMIRKYNLEQLKRKKQDRVCTVSQLFFFYRKTCVLNTFLILLYY